MISTSIRKAGPFVGNGTASEFPFAFKVFSTSDLMVVRVDTTAGVEEILVLGDSYEAVLNEDQDNEPGGTITLIGDPLATGFSLVISSEIEQTQETQIANLGAFYPEVITKQFDKQVILIQQLQEQINRSMKFPISDPTYPALDLPPAAQRAKKLMAFGDDGSVSLVTTTPDGATVGITGDSPTLNSALLTGDTTIQNLNGVPYANEYPGANLGEKINAAIAALPSTGGEIRIRRGSYSIPLGVIVVDRPVRFVGDSPYSTVLSFTGASGKAFSFEYTTSPYGNVQQWGASIENCGLIGPGGIDGAGNAGTGINLGTATLAPTGVRILNSVIAGFSKGLTWGTGSAAYLEVVHSVFANNTQDLPYDAAVNAGTNATFDDVKFLNWASAMAANKLVFSSAVGGKFVFKNCGFNNSQVVVSSPAMWIFFDNPTFENDSGNTTLHYYEQSAGSVVMKSPQLFQHYASGSVPDAIIAASGGAISIDDWNGTTAQTMTSAFKFTGNVNWHVGRQVTGVYSGGSTGFTDDVASTSAGYSTYIDHRGSVQLFPAQNGEVQPMLQVGRKNSYNIGEVDLPSDLRLTGYSAGTPTAFVSAADTSGTHDLDLTLRVQNAGTLADSLKLIHGTGSGSTVEVQDVLRLGSSGPSVLKGAASSRNAVRTAYPSVALGSTYLSTAGKAYLKVANAGADTDWERLTSSAAD